MHCAPRSNTYLPPFLPQDAIGALGGKRDSPSDDGGSSHGSDPGQHLIAADQPTGDYRRGQRFKRVARMLMGEGFKASIRRFKWKVWGAAAFITIVTIVCFVYMFLMIGTLQVEVQTLEKTGSAGDMVRSGP